MFCKYSKKEIFVVISLSFLLYILIFIRIGFILGIEISHYTLVFAIITYAVLISTIFSIKSSSNATRSGCYHTLGIFLIFLVYCTIAANILARTFDTSWDGQGYHQTAVIALSNNWNPIHDHGIQLKHRLPSQVFAEGYPSALWELQAPIFTAIGKINAAKVLQVYTCTIAALLSYIFLKKIRFSTLSAIVVTIVLTIHPVFVNQFLTFMQDGVGYQVMLIAVLSLLIHIIDQKTYWAIWTFCVSVLLLVSMKYSLVPISLLLSAIFGLVVLNRLLNRTYTITKQVKISAIILLAITAICAYVPYIRNAVVYGSPVYPTNIPDLMGSVEYNNVPQNLDKDNKLNLIFHGIFSRSQYARAGAPEHPDNQAQLKIPFTYSFQEITDAASLYNNRVGAAGPLFSGSVVIAVTMLLITTFRTKSRADRYVVYTSYFIIFIIIGLSLLTPAPNLQRYVTQMYLIPFAVVIPFFAHFKDRFVSTLSSLTIALLLGNVVLTLVGSISFNTEQQRAVRAELETMKRTGQRYMVGAQHFYSNYLMLAENNVNFVASDHLVCRGDKHSLVASSFTTYYCIE